MQLALVDSGRSVGTRAATERAAAARTESPAPVEEVSRPEPQRVVGSVGDVGSIRRGLKGIDPQLNRQISGTQQALSFLDSASAQLQGLKTALIDRANASRKGVVSDEAAAAQLDRQVRQFNALWRERPTAAAGMIDSQLRFVDVGEAEQRFAVRGLQMASLQAGVGETLYVAVAGRSQHAAAVVIDPELSAQEIARRFDRAVAPSGIRVAADAQGELSFSVRESAWPNLRDALAIKGEGRRFPTGAFNAVRVTPQPPAIQPEAWSAPTEVAVRNTLRQVVTAEQLVRDAHFEAQRALAGMGQRFQSPQNKERLQQEGVWSAAFSQTFAATGARGDYQSLAAISPALRGMHRDRVVALLAKGA